MRDKILSLLGFTNGREPSIRDAMATTIFYIAAALLFAVGLFAFRGAGPSLAFVTGYLVEKALSIDNLFVFLTLFSLFGVSGGNQRRILTYGIAGAFVFRGLMIGAGSIVLQAVPLVAYLLGGFLVYTGYKVAMQRDDDEYDPNGNPLIRLVKRVLPVADNVEGDQFFVRRAGRLLATPLLLVLVIVEVTDVMFAFDSIPAVLAITPDPFIVFTSNAFAILGLRALYFVVAAWMRQLRYLKYALSAILGFIGSKMLLADVIEIPIAVSLLVTVGALVAAVIASRLSGAAQPANEAEVRPRELLTS